MDPVDERPDPPRPRPSIDERAERRQRLNARGGTDRYGSLMHALQAGQEIPWGRTQRRSRPLEWHPIAWVLLRAAIIVVLGYAAVSFGYNVWRDRQLETWAGPDASVTSGQRLADCPLVNELHDDTFPTWLRLDGAIYRLTDSIRPVGFKLDADYPATGYTLGPMTLLRVANSPDGAAGRIVVVKLDTSAVGRVYLATPDCQ